MFLAIATVGIERIDLFGGHGPFRLTPSVVFLTIAAGALVVDVVRTRRLAIDRFTALGLALIGTIVVVSLISVVANAPTMTSIGRWVLLCVAMTGTAATALLAVRLGAAATVRRAAFTGLAVFLVFDLVQAASAACGSHCTTGGAGVFDMTVKPLGNEVIRLTGGSLDPNRAAVLVAVLVFLAVQDKWTACRAPAWISWLTVSIGGGLVLLTWSRSGAMAFLVIVVGTAASLAWTSGHRKRVVVVASGLLGILVAVSAATFLIAPRFADYIVTTRLSITSGDSASSHLNLYGVALQAIAHDPLIVLRGIGYGQSYRVVELVEPSMGIYGNFHSLFITFLIETGAIGLVAIVALLVLPLRRGRLWLSIGAILFGVFYQGVSDPTFWLQVALLWVFPAAGASTAPQVDAAKRMEEIA